VEAADTGPFFHNNSVETIEGAVAFYDGEAFNNSPAGRLLAQNDPDGNSIELDATQIVAVAAFLRVLNAVENIRQTTELLQSSSQKGIFDQEGARPLLQRALKETDDAIRVLKEAGLHPDAVLHLEESKRLTQRAVGSLLSRRRLTERAMQEQREARSRLVAAG
jgi:hypothetical protein